MPTVPSDADIRARLRGAGLRATAARVAVLRILQGHAAPSSHPEVFAALSEDGWDRATLYRNLVDLTEAGILRRVDLGDHLWRYELKSAPATDRHGDAEHPHFLCTTCGDLACLPPLEIPVPKGRVPRSLTAGRVAIEFRGVCDRCGGESATRVSASGLQ
jgi:Fur family ferric uptake transcriptional regulator